MRDILPILIVGAIIGTFALLFLVAFFTAKRKKVLENRERNMPDSEIIPSVIGDVCPVMGEELLKLSSSALFFFS